MPTASQAKIAAKTKIPRSCPPNPAFKPAIKVTLPKQNISPISEPKHASTFTNAVFTTPRKSRKSTGMQTSVIVAEPITDASTNTETDEIQLWQCFQCCPTKDLESSLSLMYHKKYCHDRDFSCPVQGCKRKDYKDWKSLLSNHIRKQHKALWNELRAKPSDYNHQPFYEKLDRVNLKPQKNDWKKYWKTKLAKKVELNVVLLCIIMITVVLLHSIRNL